MSGKSENIIELKHISKVYSDNGFKAVDDFNLEVKRGEFVTFLGPSGCGKTTTLRMIAGFELPTDGQILLNGEDISQLPANKRPINTVFQRYALFPHMNIYENIAFGLKLKKLPKEEIRKKVKHVLDMVDLEGFEDRKISTLSGGQQQRVSFARALAYGKDCILFDEPLSALDAKLREEMRSEIRDLVTRLHVTAVFVTHDQIEAMSMSDRIAVLSRGIIEQYDTPEIIYSHPASPFTARFVGTANWLDAHHLFRPEKGHLESREKDVFYVANVLSSQFQGQNYQIRLTRKGQTWTLPAERALPQGSPVRICVSPDDIIEV